jgi:hypothetical protein
LNTTGNVGVGTLTPDGKFQVNGSVKMDNLNQAQASDTSLLFLDGNGKV